MGASQSLSLEEFDARLRFLVKETNYPVEHNYRFLRYFLVLGMDSDRVRKDCFTFKEARDMARSEESEDKQLQLMNTEVHSINIPKGLVNETGDHPLTLGHAGKPQGTVAGAPILERSAQ